MITLEENEILLQEYWNARKLAGTNTETLEGLDRDAGKLKNVGKLEGWKASFLKDIQCIMLCGVETMGQNVVRVASHSVHRGMDSGMTNSICLSCLIPTFTDF